MALPMPVHPIFIHFPIALFFLELLFLLFAVTKQDDFYRRAALFTFRIAFLGMLTAMGTGLVDTGGFDGIAGKVRPHYFGALAVAVIQMARGILWHVGPQDAKKIKILFGLSLIAYAAIIFTGFEGGEIVYSEAA